MHVEYLFTRTCSTSSLYTHTHTHTRLSITRRKNVESSNVLGGPTISFSTEFESLSKIFTSVMNTLIAISEFYHASDSRVRDRPI